MNFALFTIVLICALAAFVSAGTYNGTVTGDNCGGNCPGGCDSCPCGTSTNYLDIAAWCAQYSGWNQANCQCIISRESGGNANAVNQNSQGGSYKWDVGLWQVNSFNWDSCSGGGAPCDPQTNLNCAIKVFQWGGNTWTNWSTCGACGCCNSN